MKILQSVFQRETDRFLTDAGFFKAINRHFIYCAYIVNSLEV